MPPQKPPKNASAAVGAPIEGHDDISNLPDDVLQHVLSFLPAQDVVRTCVLAKRWRHMWESTTVLRFVCGGTKEPESMEEIQEFVDRLLRLRISGATPLDTCEFRLGETDVNESRLDVWIRIALQCKVRELRLSCGGISHPIFISQYLKKLQLEGFDDVVPTRLLEFSCCPNLEDLKIAHCCLVGAVLISSQSLKRLIIQYCYLGHHCRLPIWTPNLVSLWLQVDHGMAPMLRIQRMPSLLTACVIIRGYDPLTLEYDDDDDDDDDDNDDDDDSNQSILLQGLSEVRNLELIYHYTEPLTFRRDLEFCSNFNNLKCLLLNEYWCEPADFRALACILKLSPVLEKLTLQLYSTGPTHKVEIKLSCKQLEMSGAISQHLNTLEVKCEVYDERINNVLTFLSKKLNIWFQFSGYKISA